MVPVAQATWEVSPVKHNNQHQHQYKMIALLVIDKFQPDKRFGLIDLFGRHNFQHQHHYMMFDRFDLDMFRLHMQFVKLHLELLRNALRMLQYKQRLQMLQSMFLLRRLFGKLINATYEISSICIVKKLDLLMVDRFQHFTVIGLIGYQIGLCNFQHRCLSKKFDRIGLDMYPLHMQFGLIDR